MAGEGQRNCTWSDVTFAVARTGRVVRGQPEYRVKFAAPCPCPVTGVRVWCGGVEDSAEPVDGSKVELHEGICVLKQPISAGSPLSFTYTSHAPVNFRVYSAAAQC
ncbi:hypothetical protein ABZP36_009145 [Zizania latifolia]